MLTMTLGHTHFHMHTHGTFILVWNWWVIINTHAIIVPKSLWSFSTLRNLARGLLSLVSFYDCSLKHTFIICYNIAHSSPNDTIKHNSIFTSSSCVLVLLIYPHFYFIFPPELQQLQTAALPLCGKLWNCRVTKRNNCNGRQILLT